MYRFLWGGPCLRKPSLSAISLAQTFRLDRGNTGYRIYDAKNGSNLIPVHSPGQAVNVLEEVPDHPMLDVSFAAVPHAGVELGRDLVSQVLRIHFQSVRQILKGSFCFLEGAGLRALHPKVFGDSLSLYLVFLKNRCAGAFRVPVPLTI